MTKGSAVVSSQTSQAEVQSLIDRAVKLGDPKLAADIRQFASTRQYGLVFEHNRPERMRLYGKPVTARDIVQVLPPTRHRRIGGEPLAVAHLRVA